jgi:cell division protease FtsH
VNWKVIILFTIALAIIFVAIDQSGTGNRKPLKFPEFREALLEGRILQTADEEGFDGGQLELVTFSGETRAELLGYYAEDQVLVERWDNQKPVKAAIQVDIDSFSDELNQSFGERLEWVDEVPDRMAKAEKIPFAKMRSLLAENRLVLGPDQEFKIYREKGSDEAVMFALQGDPVPFSKEKLGEMKNGGDLIPFVVKLNKVIMSNDLAALIKANVSTRSEDNTFGKVMMSLLPVLLLIVLIFFLFRHQMKSAGRGAMSFGKS